MARIIIVEDDPMIAEIYHKKFAASGFEVFVVNGGDEALNVAKIEKPDVVMTDLIMPKMDGFQLIEKLRGGEYDPNIRIIVTSNLSQKEDQEKAMKAGANGFLAKADFTPSNLVKEVERLLGQYQHQQKNEAKANVAASQDVEVNEEAVSKKKILMIEDEEIFIDMFGEKLKQDGFMVDDARNGAWGIKEAMNNDYDLIILDMVMPAMTGDEMLEKLKMEDKTKNIPVIVLSASVDGEMEKKVRAMGAQEFFIKTQITPSQLSEKAEELLNK
jgi:DNA-binding response OmpR family regulator